MEGLNMSVAQIKKIADYPEANVFLHRFPDYFDLRLKHDPPQSVVNALNVMKNDIETVLDSQLPTDSASYWFTNSKERTLKLFEKYSLVFETDNVDLYNCHFVSDDERVVSVIYISDINDIV